MRSATAVMVQTLRRALALGSWSDYGPSPRTMHQVVYELHTLLTKANEPPPYVLVGHSYGGWIVRLYTATYPSDVKGMVLVEAGADDPVRVLGDGKPRHGRLVVATHSGHHVQIDEPELVIDAIRDVVVAARK